MADQIPAADIVTTACCGRDRREDDPHLVWRDWDAYCVDGFCQEEAPPDAA